jgi:hypothetical protein
LSCPKAKNKIKKQRYTIQPFDCAKSKEEGGIYGCDQQKSSQVDEGLCHQQEQVPVPFNGNIGGDEQDFVLQR